MKVIAFNGSPKKQGNTKRALEIVTEEIAKSGIETEIIDLGGLDLKPCTACGACKKNKDRRCVLKDDLNPILAKMFEADGFLIGSPTYFGNVTPQAKALIDRAGYVAMGNGNLFKRKVGAGVAVNRRAGALETLQSINNLFLISQMIVPGSSYWNVITALAPGEIEKDEEGIRTMKTLGENFAWVVKKLNS